MNSKINIYIILYYLLLLSNKVDHFKSNFDQSTLVGVIKKKLDPKSHSHLAIRYTYFY